MTFALQAIETKATMPTKGCMNNNTILILLAPMTQIAPFALSQTTSSLAKMLSTLFPISLISMHTISFILYATTDSKWCEHNTLAHTYIVINIVDITVSGLHIQELAVDVWCFLCNQFKLQDPIVIQDMCLHLAFLWYEDEMAVANYFKRLHLL